MIRAALLLVLLCFGVARAQLPPGLSAADQSAIQSTISRQIDAFRRDDAGTAYRFAAPKIRELFPTADGFMAMVKRGYQPVYRPRSAEFSELAVRDGQVVQEVELVGPDGKPALAVYTMVRDAEAGWLIAGCVLLPSIRLTT